MDNELSDNIEEIVKELKKRAHNEISLGWEDGLMGISFFFFYYARYINDESYEDYAYELLEKILYDKNLNSNVAYSNGLSGIGSCIYFLIKEGFLEDESNSFLDDFDSMIIGHIDNVNPYDFSFTSGFSGICRYLLIRKKHFRVIDTVLHKMLKFFTDPCPIDPVFLFPSEVLGDVKLLLREIENLRLSVGLVLQLKVTIARFEKNGNLLYSNCPDYYLIQNMREAVIENTNFKPSFYLDQIRSESSNIIFIGLSYLSTNMKLLPPWWVLL